MPKDERRKLESRSQKCIFLGYGCNGNFEYWTWDPKDREVLHNADIVFNDSDMHMVAECPIELRRVTFTNATPSDGLAMHTGAVLQSIASMASSITPTGTSTDPNHVGHTSTGTDTPAISATLEAPKSPVLTRRSDKLTQPPEGYSLG